MTTIHLTDAQRDQFAACGLIVIDAQGVNKIEPAVPEDARRQLLRGVGGTTSTADSPALAWRQLTAPCDCGTTGYERVWFDPDCPDCVGGRRVVTITATCSKCKGVGVSQAGAYACSAAGCLGSGVVTLGRFTIPALLPVVTHHIKGWHGYVSGSGRAWIVEPNERQTMLTLDPLPRPGQFIARPKPAT